MHLPPDAVAAVVGLLCVPEQTVRKIERGAVPTPALCTVAAIADVLGLTLDELVREAAEARGVAAVA